jgi:siderophore synthetase component
LSGTKTKHTMAQTFRIAEVHRLDNFATIGERSTVKESMFWHLLAGKVREAQRTTPENFDERFNQVKKIIIEKRGSTIIDTYFEIKGKP